MKNLIRWVLLSLMWIVPSLYAQSTGVVMDFNSGYIGNWEVSSEMKVTYTIIPDAQAMKIIYTRTGSSWEWDQIHTVDSMDLDISKNPAAAIRVRSTVNTKITLLVAYRDGKNDFFTGSVDGNNLWATLYFKTALTASSYQVKQLYLYLDGGSKLPSGGSVWVDEIRLGDSVAIPPNYSELNRSISTGLALKAYSKEGTDEGQYPAGTKTAIQAIVDKLRLLITAEEKHQDVIDKAVAAAYDEYSKLEATVVTAPVDIVDKKANKQTRYLFRNLKNQSGRAFMYGMQVATGSGVGWDNDDTRSDAKDVCGDYPAIDAEDLNFIFRGWDGGSERARYRISTFYNRGGIATLCWHTYDMDGVGFYAADVNNARIAATIIPGGPRHREFTNQLTRIGDFLKSLRGNRGEAIPVIIRPYHEHLGDWFWWGPSSCTTTEYNALWKFTVSYLRDSLNVHNALYAISPPFDNIKNDSSYFQVYPGDDYVDIFGMDKYFAVYSQVTETERQGFLSGLRIAAKNASDRKKVFALTEFGQAGLADRNWFSRVILATIKSDTLAANTLYGVTWKNTTPEGTYAPYQYSPSVPDFMKFYTDPFTSMEADLPDMYAVPAPDVTPPVFVSKHDAPLISPTKLAPISVETNERATVRYSFVDEAFDAMPYAFTGGEKLFTHTVLVQGRQDEQRTIYVKARDIDGNITSPLAVAFIVDTMTAPIRWTDKLYPASAWLSGKTPIGTDASVLTKTAAVRTVYFRKTITLDHDTAAFGLLFKYKGGAVVYVNGKEIGRVGMPEALAIDYDTDPLTANNESKMYVLNLNGAKDLVKGDNIIAVEAHGTLAAPVANFNAQVINAQNKVLYPLGSDWSYYDSGARPKDVLLKDAATGVAAGRVQPERFDLLPNFPNPFNPKTTIWYDVAASDLVNIAVYDVLGREVATLVNDVQSRGRKQASFDGANLSSGMYFLQMRVRNFVKIQKMILMK